LTKKLVRGSITDLPVDKAPKRPAFRAAITHGDPTDVSPLVFRLVKRKPNSEIALLIAALGAGPLPWVGLIPVPCAITNEVLGPTGGTSTFGAAFVRVGFQ